MRTFFGVGAGTYNPIGSAWKAGLLLGERIEDGTGTVLERRTYAWTPSTPLSNEDWGDPWIGFDTEVRVPQLQQQVVERSGSTWTTTHTSFNSNFRPRCTTETGSAGTRYRLQVYDSRRYDLPGHPEVSFVMVEDPLADLLRASAFSATHCDPNGSFTISPGIDDQYTRLTYDAQGRVTTKKVNAHRTDYLYHADGSLRAEIIYQGYEDTQGVATDGFCKTFDDYLYGVARQVGEGATAPDCIDPLYVTTRTVNLDGTIASATDGRGHVTTFLYDGLGRVVEISAAGRDPITVTHDGDSLVSSSTRRVTQGLFWLESRFDGLGREVEKENAEGVFQVRRYDAMGRVEFESLPSNNASTSDGSTFTYDLLGRTRSITYGDGTGMTYAYPAGDQTIVTDALDRSTTLWHKAYGDPSERLLVRVQRPGDPEPTADQYLYTVTGLLKETRLGTRKRTIAYNRSKQIKTEFNPESGTTYFGYDAAGNLRCRNYSYYCSDAGWATYHDWVHAITVDGLGRVTRVRSPTYPIWEATFTYRGDADLLDRVQDPVGEHVYDYTPGGKLSSELSTISGVAYQTEYIYDSRGNLASIQYPSGRLVSFEYDAANRLIRIPGFVTQITYHPNGFASSMTYANGVTTTLTLDGRRRPDRIHAAGVLDLDYAYDDAGNITAIDDALDPAHSVALGYDEKDRLESATGAWGQLEFEYNQHALPLRQEQHPRPQPADHASAPFGHRSGDGRPELGDRAWYGDRRSHRDVRRLRLRHRVHAGDAVSLR